MSEPYLLAINPSIKVNNKTVCGAENCFIWFIITCKSFYPLDYVYSYMYIYSYIYIYIYTYI